MVDMDNFINKFPDCRKLVSEYQMYMSVIEVNQPCLWKYIRGELCENGTYRPIFLSDAQDVLEVLSMAELKLLEIEADAEQFEEIMGTDRSLLVMTQSIQNIKRATNGDKIVAEFGPQAEELRARLKAANKILEKYN